MSKAVFGASLLDEQNLQKVAIAALAITARRSHRIEPAADVSREVNFTKAGRNVNTLIGHPPKDG
jgi:hypothetical protein